MVNIKLLSEILRTSELLKEGGNYSKDNPDTNPWELPAINEDSD